VPARIWRVIVRGLARDPAARWPSILAAAEALQSRRRGILVPLAFTVALGAAAIALVIPSAPAAPPQTDPPALPSAKAAADVDARLAEVRASLDDAGARRDGAAQAALLETLFSEAAANERPDVAARAAIRRSDLAFMLGDVAEAERWRQQAEVHVLRGSIMDVQELAVLEQLRGKAASIAGDDVQAEEDLRWAVFLATFPGGHDPLRERTLRRALGEHLLERGRPEEALLEFETAHQRLTDAFGVDDARVIESYMDLGVGTVRAGDPARGYAIVREACDRPEFTAVSEIAVGCLTNLGMAEQYAGDLPAARRSFEAALEMLRAQPRRDEHREAVLHSSLGIVLQQLGDESGALEHLQRSMTLFESVLGPEHPLTLETALNIAELVIARGDVERGRARLRKIVATLQRNGASKIERGWPVALLARAVEPDEAIPLLEEVLDGSSLVEADPIAAAWCMYELGRVVFERGEHARGLALVRRARTLTETTRDARYDQEALPPADRWLNTHADRGTK
jgi:tetratricopeptide (TPR) repeat protein